MSYYQYMIWAEFFKFTIKNWYIYSKKWLIIKYIILTINLIKIKMEEIYFKKETIFKMKII